MMENVLNINGLILAFVFLGLSWILGWRTVKILPLGMENRIRLYTGLLAYAAALLIYRGAIHDSFSSRDVEQMAIGLYILLSAYLALSFMTDTVPLFSRLVQERHQT